MAAVVRHKFAEKSHQVSADTSLLRRVSDKYAAGMATAIEQIAGIKTEVTAQDGRFLSYGEWSSGLENLSSLSVFRLLPLRGSLILFFKEMMINNLVELYFGGTLGPAVARQKDCFRDAEMQLIARLQEALIQRLGDCFADHAIIKPALINHETNPLHVTICKPDEQILCQTFQVAIAQDVVWTIAIAYSAEAAESAIELVRNSQNDNSEESDPDWQRQWLDGLKNIRLPLRMILAQPELRLPELFEIKPGDVIPIAPRVRPPLFVANHKFATGTLGEKNGCAAFKIERLEQGDT